MLVSWLAKFRAINKVEIVRDTELRSRIADAYMTGWRDSRRLTPLSEGNWIDASASPSASYLATCTKLCQDCGGTGAIFFPFQDTLICTECHRTGMTPS